MKAFHDSFPCYSRAFQCRRDEFDHRSVSFARLSEAVHAFLVMTGNSAQFLISGYGMLRAVSCWNDVLSAVLTISRSTVRLVHRFAVSIRRSLQAASQVFWIVASGSKLTWNGAIHDNSVLINAQEMFLLQQRCPWSSRSSAKFSGAFSSCSRCDDGYRLN
jgi:hypothetical protein